VDRISAVFPRAMPKTRRANRHRSALQLSKRAQRRRNRDGGQRMRHASTYGVHAGPAATPNAAGSLPGSSGAGYDPQAGRC
jgi:hypothetical protein